MNLSEFFGDMVSQPAGPMLNGPFEGLNEKLSGNKLGIPGIDSHLAVDPTDLGHAAPASKIGAALAALYYGAGAIGEAGAGAAEAGGGADYAALGYGSGEAGMYGGAGDMAIGYGGAESAPVDWAAEGWGSGEAGMSSDADGTVHYDNPYQKSAGLTSRAYRPGQGTQQTQRRARPVDEGEESLYMKLPYASSLMRAAIEHSKRTGEDAYQSAMRLQQLNDMANVAMGRMVWQA